MTINRTFQVLIDLGTPSALDVIMEALDEPDERVQRRAAECILERGDRSGHAVLIQICDSLYPEVRQLLERRALEMLPTLVSSARSARERTRINAYNLLRATRSTDVAVALAGGLVDASEEVRRIAASGLKELTLKVLQEDPQELPKTITPMRDGEGLSPIRHSLMQGLLQAVKSYRDHRNEVVLECLAMLGAETYWVFLDAIVSGDTPLAADAARIMESFNTPASLSMVFALAGERLDGPREVALEILRRKGGARFAKAFSEYLMGIPREQIAKLATLFDDPSWWEKTAQHIIDLGKQVAERVMILLEHARIPARRKVDLLQSLMTSRLAYVRSLALDLLSRIDPASAETFVENALSDPDEEVQCKACEIVGQLGLPNRMKLLAPLINSKSDSVRTAAVRVISEDSFKKYLASFDSLDERVRELAGKAIAKIDPNIVDKLAEELHSLDPARRLKAARILDIVEREKEAEPLLLELMSDRDRRVRATVVKMLGILGSVDALKHLIKALSDPDRRVMANAIEAFEDLNDPRVADLLLPFLKHPDNRIRANAAKALYNLGHPEVKSVLFEMLSDANEFMRMSAVWALGELKMDEGESILADMATSDPSEGVRNRARASLEKLRMG